MHSPRANLSALLVLLCLTAGCLSGVSGDGTPSPTAQTGTTTTATATTTPSDHHAALDQPDPDKEVVVQNRWNRSAEMQVRVVRDATGETVHDGTDTLAPGTERTVYNVSAADPEGVETFTVVVTARNTTDRVSIETNRCYGNAYAEILDDGTLYVYYSIC
jgi:hypothetical protein